MIAYFAMEIGLEDRMSNYSGGLGTLVGDTLYAYADIGIPAVGVTLLYKKGYVSQSITPSGMQLDFDTPWDYKRILKPTNLHLQINFGDLIQEFTAWEYSIISKEEVKVFFLDASLPKNDPEIRKLNDRLYYDDGILRLRQEILLGIGGYRLLKALGYNISVYHINESHSGFLVVELMKELGSKEEVRKKCVFTTHTPVPVGHDKFPVDMVKHELKSYDPIDWDKEAEEGFINLSKLSLNYSGKVNAVSYKHMFVSSNIFPECSLFSESYCKMDYVTNGVYHKRWIHREIQELFNNYLPGWDENPTLLGQAYYIPAELLLKTHMRIKSDLINLVNKLTDSSFSDDVFTICVARRITAYKRNNLILSDLEKLKYIAEHNGDIQIIFAGKAHPKDTFGKEMIADIINKSKKLKEMTKSVKVAFLENYSIDMAKLLVAGCDVWLNNPRRPYEACGTSGMKAGMNGVLNFSTWDGWWLEGGIEGINGWGIGPKPKWDDLSESDDKEDLEDLYGKLAHIILPMFYSRKDEWVRMMKNSIATIGPYFNTYRMTYEYLGKIYQIGLG